MDNSVDRSWATPRAAAFALCAGGLILLGAAVLAAPDALGLLMMGVAGVLLIAFGGYALIIRPRLAIDDEALTDTDRETIRQAAKTTASRFPPMSAEQAELIRHQLRGDAT